MAKIIIKEIKVCSDCDNEIYTCDSCGNYFDNDDEIICQESDTLEKHYCQNCSDK